MHNTIIVKIIVKAALRALVYACASLCVLDNEGIIVTMSALLHYACVIMTRTCITTLLRGAEAGVYIYTHIHPACHTAAPLLGGDEDDDRPRLHIYI
jgi:hypothetical protein